MPRTIYQRGADKERKIVNRARAEGHIAFRSAGSHSPIDVCIIDRENKRITFVQSKGEKLPDSAKVRLEAELAFLNDTYEVSFHVE